VTGLSITVDRIVVQTDVEREAAARIPEVLREAFLRLAERWGRSAWARSIPLDAIVRAQLEIEPITPDDLLGDRGAEQLAERMWQALLDTFEVRA
jgi:hypothetical protein